MSKSGLFVGLVTVDLIYLAASCPKNNQKIVATDYTIAAGGPATNAAVAFSYLGNHNTSTLLGAVGSHPLAQLIHQDLQNYQVKLQDLLPTNSNPPPISSIVVTQTSGERAVVSINAVQIQAPCEAIPPDILHDIDIVMLDGHQMAVGIEIVQKAKAENKPIVIDGGSWKAGFEQLLPFVDYAICSANFYPPNCHTQEDVFAYLSQFGIPYIAITHGEKPIEYLTPMSANKQEKKKNNFIEVPKTHVVDTLGAGDIFHGAFCHYILRHNFIDALASAAKIAAFSCQFFGTRRWMKA